MTTSTTISAATTPMAIKVDESSDGGGLVEVTPSFSVVETSSTVVTTSAVWEKAREHKNLLYIQTLMKSNK